MLRAGETMKAETFQWLVLMTGVMVIVGSGCSQPRDKEACLPPGPPRPFIFYDETGNPSKRTPALSRLELQEIVDWLATQTPDPVWLIRVRPSIGNGVRHSMVAYLVSDEATPRIRVGRAYDIPKSKDEAGIRSPWQYAQVSMPGHSFTRELTKPAVTDMPFRWPVVADPNSRSSSPMPKEEVIGIVDFARRQSRSALIPGIRWEAQKLPILGISREGDTVRVEFGFQHGPLWGHGVAVVIKRTTTGYKVVSWSRWVS